MSLQLIASDVIPSMMDCPKWDSCSAPVCPLHGPSGIHFSEEEVCPYLREAAKGVNGIPPSGPYSVEIMQVARSVWERKQELPYQLLKTLNRVSQTPSKRSTQNLVQKAA